MRRSVIVSALLVGGPACSFDWDRYAPSAAATATPTASPEITITSPAEGAVLNGVATVRANATADARSGGLASVVFRLDGETLGVDEEAPFEVTFATASVAPGPHTLTAIATDLVGLATTSAAVGVIVESNTTGPTVAVTLPVADATVWKETAISATASSSVGVEAVQFQVDGAAIGAPDASAPYSVPWDTTDVSTGLHSITAVAVDAVGNLTTSAPVAVTVARDLVAAYNFNQGSGTTVDDKSGHGHVGTIIGATWSTEGKHGGALNFNDPSAIVTVPPSELLDFETAFTLELWLFAKTVSGSPDPPPYRTVLVKALPEGSNSPREAYTLCSRSPSADMPGGYIWTGAEYAEVSGGSSLENAWHHLAMTYDDGTMRLFVDGTEVAAHEMAGPLTTGAGELSIGGNSQFPEEDFVGTIDAVRIYDRALTAAEINDDMNSPIQ